MERPSRLLVVDDDPALCAALASGLGDAGNEIHCAFDGRQALAMLTGGGFDLALIDMVLRGAIDGKAVAGRALERGVHVILISGALDADERADGRPFPLLRKPFRLRMLKDLMSATGRRSWRRSGCEA